MYYNAEKGEVFLRGVGTLRHFAPPKASVHWQPDGLTIQTKRWLPRAGFLGAPPISPIPPPISPYPNEHHDDDKTNIDDNDKNDNNDDNHNNDNNDTNSNDNNDNDNDNNNTYTNNYNTTATTTTTTTNNNNNDKNDPSQVLRVAPPPPRRPDARSEPVLLGLAGRLLRLINTY